MNFGPSMAARARDRLRHPTCIDSVFTSLFWDPSEMPIPARAVVYFLSFSVEKKRTR